MSTTTTKSTAELKAARAKLNAQIRAAERAEKKAAAQRLLDAKQALGVRLADATGVTTPEGVERLWEALDLDQLRTVAQAAQEVTPATSGEAGQHPAEVAEPDRAPQAGWSS